MTKVKQLTVARLIELLQAVENKEMEASVLCLNLGGDTLEITEVVVDYGELILVVE